MESIFFASKDIFGINILESLSVLTGRLSGMVKKSRVKSLLGS
jgi:hypothetical protein